MHGQQSQAQAGGDAPDADDEALPHEDPHDLPAGSADGFQQSDLARLHYYERDGGAGDAERGDDDDEEKNVEHQILLDHDGGERGVGFEPGQDFKIRAKSFGQLPFGGVGLERIVEHYDQGVDVVAELIHLLRIFERHGDDGGVVFLPAHVEDAAHFIFVRQNGLLIRLAPAVLEPLDFARRINVHAVADLQVHVSCERVADDQAAPAHVKFSVHDAGGQGADRRLQFGIHAAHPRRINAGLAVLVGTFQQHLAEHDGGG